jgi:membrane-associated phospholipid phosphatase
MRTVALVITKVLNPFVTSLAAIAIVIFVQQMPSSQKVLWFALGVLVAAVPTLILYLAARKGEVTSFWAPEGKERTKAFWAWVVVALAYVVLVYLAAAPKLIVALGLVLLILGFVNLLVSSSFKLSVHSELVTLLVLISILTVSVNLILLVPLVVLVGWARVYLKQHSLSEVTFGIFASGVAVYLVFALFGLATF